MESKAVPLLRFQWMWQSNNNPWNKQQKPEWTPYSQVDNVSIEKSFQKGKARVDVGHYQIVFATMVQINKEDISKKRPVQRIEVKIINSRGDRFHGEMPCKTTNLPFGDYRDFQKILKIEFDKGQYGMHYDEIRKELVKGLKKSLSASKQETIDDTNLFQKMIDYKKEKFLKKVLSHLFTSTKDVEYSDAQVLDFVQKLYTLNTFLYNDINTGLRNLDWETIRKYKYYIYALLESFDKKSSVIKGNSIILYRGANLPVNSVINDYANKQNEAQFFSWNSFTSATKERSVTEQYLKGEGDRVLFQIHADLRDKQLRRQLQDLSIISQYENETEVLIAPGSIYKIISCQKIDGLNIIDLEIIPKSYALDFIKQPLDSLQIRSQYLQTFLQKHQVITILDIQFNQSKQIYILKTYKSKELVGMFTFTAEEYQLLIQAPPSIQQQQEFQQYNWLLHLAETKKLKFINLTFVITLNEELLQAFSQMERGKNSLEGVNIEVVDHFKDILHDHGFVRCFIRFYFIWLTKNQTITIIFRDFFALATYFHSFIVLLESKWMKYFQQHPKQVKLKIIDRSQIILNFQRVDEDIDELELKERETMLIEQVLSDLEQLKQLMPDKGNFKNKSDYQRELLQLLQS